MLSKLLYVLFTIKVYAIAARFLSRAYHAFDNADRQPLNELVIKNFSISINHFVKNNNSGLSYHFEHGLLKEKSNIVICYNAINNSFTAHHSNNFNSITPKQLATFILELQTPRCRSFIQSEGQAPYAFDNQRDAMFALIRVTENLLSRRKQNNISLVFDNSKLHQPPCLEIKPVFIVLNHQNNIKTLS